MYLISEVRSQSVTASNFLLVDPDREGLFSYVSNDTTSDNGGTVLVSANRRRYCRVIEGAVNVKWFGAKGDRTTDDTQAIQTAINYVQKAADPKLYSYIPRYSGNPGTLLIPVGGFKVSNLRVNGSILFIGQGGGPTLVPCLCKRNEGEPILLLGPDTDGTSNSTVIENIMFKSVSAISNPNSAQIKTLEGISTNDIYIRNCWFQNSETNAIWITQGDDIQISGCTFDVLPYNAIQLGTVGEGLRWVGLAGHL